MIVLSYYPRGYYIINKRVICKYYDYLYYILTNEGEWKVDGYAMTAYYDAAYDVDEVSEELVYNRIGQLKLKTLKDEKIALSAVICASGS